MQCIKNIEILQNGSLNENAIKLCKVFQEFVDNSSDNSSQIKEQESKHISHHFTNLIFMLGSLRIVLNLTI